MDFFSHVASGWILSEKLELAKKEKRILILSSIFPDFDIFIGIFLYLFVDHDLGRDFHRGITHTFFFGIIFGLALLILIRHSSKRRIFLLGFLGVALHCIIDQIITFSYKYPQLLYPLSSRTLELNQIGTLPLIIVYAATYLLVWLGALKIYLAKRA